MAARVSFFVCVVLLASISLCCNGASGAPLAAGQTGITIERATVYATADGDKPVRVIDPGTTLQVTGAEGKRLRVASPREDQSVEGWVDAKNLFALDPSTPYHRALAYQGAGEVKQAIDAYTEAIESDPTNARAYYNRALLSRGRGDTSGAIADCTAAIKIDGQLAEAYLTRGNAYANQNDLDSAVKDFDKAIAIRPKYALAYYNRGLVRHRQAQTLVQQQKGPAADEQEQKAFDDLQRAKAAGLPALIAKRLDQVGRPTDIMSAADAGYITILARGSLGVYGVGGKVKSLVPLDPRVPIVVNSGTVFASAGAHQNMVACGLGVLTLSPGELGVFQFRAIGSALATPGSLQAASLDALLPVPENSDRFRGVTSAGEDIQKVLSFVEYPEPGPEDTEETIPDIGLLERAAIALIDRAMILEGKGRGFPDDPRTYFFFHQQVRQAAIWAVSDDLTAKDITGRLPSITEIHNRVAAKLLSLANMPNRLGVEPVSLKELSVEELFRIGALGVNQRRLASLSADSLAPILKRALKDMSAPEKEALALALKTTAAELPSKGKEILALAKEKAAAAQKDLTTVKDFIKELAVREKKAADAARVALEDIVIDDKETQKIAFEILGLDPYSMALASAFSKELSGEERAVLATAEKVSSLDKADKTFVKDITTDERSDVEVKKKTLDLALVTLSLVRELIEQSVDDSITKTGESRYLAALAQRKGVSFGDDVEAGVVHFRQWTPGTPRWEGVYYIDKSDKKCVPWRLDGRISLTIDPPPMRLGEVRGLSTTPDQDAAAYPVVGSRFARRVAPLPRPVGQFLEVTVRFRNAGQKSATVEFCTPSSVYAGAYVQLGDGTAVAPIDFALAGVVLSPESAETAKDMTVVSELALSTTGSLGFALGSRQETCALFLFDVPRDATRFNLVVMGKTIDLGLPSSATAFEPVDDNMVP
jgi:hypothetical protein